MKPLYLICKNHMDPIWRRPWARSGEFLGHRHRGYLEIEEAQLRAWLDLIEATPVSYSVEQVLTLRSFLERNPQELSRLRALADSGKLTVLGGGETVIDTNMVHGECLVRAQLYALRWQEKTFGRRPRFAIYPDTFGLSAQLPQIIQGLGFEGLVEFDRVFSQNLAFWRGLDGTVIWFDRKLGLTAGWHNLGRNRYLEPVPTALTDGTDTSDFSGLDFTEPCLNNDEEINAAFARLAAAPGAFALAFLNVEEMLPDPRLPQLPDIASRHGLRAEFTSIEALAARLGAAPLARLRAGEVVADEIDPRSEGNPTGTGCYVSRIGIKQTNRRLESLLLTAEKMAALLLPADRYPLRKFERLWNALALYQFHDSLPASHSDDAFSELRDTAQTIALGAAQIQSDSWRALAPQVACPDGPGVPVLVFNPLNWEVRGNLHTVTFPVADQEDHHAVEVWDAGGSALDVLRVATHKRAVGSVVEVEIAGLVLPPLGYTTVRCTARAVPPPGDDWEPHVFGEIEIANEFFQIRANPRHVLGINEGGSCAPVLSEGAFALRLVEDIGSPWETLAEPITSRDLTATSRVTCAIRRTPAEQVIRFTGEFTDPQAQLERGFTRVHWVQTVRLVRGIARVLVTNDVDWDTTNTRLVQGHPLSFRVQNGRLAYDIPYGVLEREAYAPHHGTHMDADGSWPALNFVSAHDEVTGRHVTLLNRGLPAHRPYDDRFDLSLARSPQVPVYSQQIEGARDAGHHVFETALLAGPGDWRTGDAVRAGLEFNTIFPHHAPVTNAAPTTTRRAAASLAANTHPAIVLSALKRAEDGSGALVARTCETHGTSAVDTWTGTLAADAQPANLLEIPATTSAATANYRPWEIKTLRLPG